MHHTSLPHRKLHAFQLAIELVRLVRSVQIGDADSRGQARKAAASAARNIGEAAGRPSGADKSRIFGIARGEVVEVAASIEVAYALGQCSEADMQAVCTMAGRVSAMLSRLIK